MSMLHSCPRCTQALPASAAFCRRCGAAVDWSVRQTAVPPVVKPVSALSAFLCILLLIALVFGGLVFFRVQSQPTAVQVSPVYPAPQAQPVYNQPTPIPIPYPVYRPQIVGSPAQLPSVYQPQIPAQPEPVYRQQSVGAPGQTGPVYYYRDTERTRGH